MADQNANEGSSARIVSDNCSDSTVELNIKTLDSQIYSFQVDKKMLVSQFKEKIANQIGVPVAQQRLIFRGKVLKDEHLLSEYHVENGHTLHLVERQQSQQQPSSGAGPGESSETNGNDGLHRNRVGQISHSVVLGTFNVGDQGEGIVPDVSRVIGAVLNSIGIGGQTTVSGAGSPQSSSTNASGHVLQGNVEDGSAVGGGGGGGGQSRAGNHAQFGQAFSGQPFHLQIPVAAAAIPVPFPSHNAPIPDSLNTLSEFMSRMERALSHNGYQPDLLSTSMGDLPRVDLPLNAQGLPTPEALSVVLRRAEQFLRSRATEALSHIAGRLEQDGLSSDPNTRGQIHTESMQIGLAMQHVGALLLELGRTIMTLRMGQSPVEAVVNAGPAVYISPVGPNPIMVQPFPLQASSLFGGGAAASNPVSFAPVSMGNPPRHINIHIHAGTSLAPIVSTVGSRGSNGENTQADHGSGTGSGDSGAARVLPARNVIAAAVPSRPSGVNAAHPGLVVSVSQPPSDSVPLSSVIADVNARIRNFVDNMQGESEGQTGEVVSAAQNSAAGSGAGIDASSEQHGGGCINEANVPRVSVHGSLPTSEDPMPQHNEASDYGDRGSASSSYDVPTSSTTSTCSVPSGEAAPKYEKASNLRCNEKQDTPEVSKSVPLGLVGGLERKRRVTQQRSVGRSGDGGTTSAPLDQNLNATIGQNVLQALTSQNSSLNRTGSNSSPFGQQYSNMGQSIGGRTLDMESAMSQVLQSPALNGLLAGFSEQAGVGSPGDLRTMMQQLTQSPVMMNTLGQIAQQVDSRELENMFSGVGRAEGGGMDLSRMVQQMMPIVSRALSGGSNFPQRTSPSEPERHELYERTTADEKPSDQSVQVDLAQASRRIECLDEPGDIFRSMLESTIPMYNSGIVPGDLIDELCSNEGLADAYMEMLCRDLGQRLQRHSAQD